MSYQLFPEERPVSPYIEAVNDARFVKTFGIIALIGSLITCGPGVMIGVGVAVLGFGGTKYFRILGVTVAVLGGLSFLFQPAAALAALVLGVGIILKGREILSVLEKEGRDDSDWEATRKRTNIGLITSAIACLIGLVWLSIFVLALLKPGLFTTQIN